MAPPRDGNLGADHVHWSKARVRPAGFFRGLAQHRRALRGHLDGHRLSVPQAVIGQRHARVKVKLRVARGDAVGRQTARVVHCALRRLAPPGERAEVVRAKYHLPGFQAVLPNDSFHERYEVRRLHARVPAELVDLVGG